MKVLQAPDTNWQYECTCAKCDAKLLVETDDLHIQKGTGAFGTASAFYCYCQICTNRITIPDNVLTKIVKINVEKRESKFSNIDMRDVGCGPPWQDK